MVRLAPVALLVFAFQTSCSEPNPGAMDAASKDLLVSTRTVFSGFDWKGFCSPDFATADSHGRRGPMRIDPPGEMFTIWSIGGAIPAAQLEALIQKVQARVRAQCEQAGAKIGSIRKVTEVPMTVVDAMFLKSQRPLGECKGFEVELIVGNLRAYVDAVASPRDKGWRLQCCFRHVPLSE